MICLKEGKPFLLVLIMVIFGCNNKHLPKIEPVLITEKTPHDTDDPAIWINRENPLESIVFGTDKDEVNGGIYAFDLEGKIIMDKTITGLSYPNNVDISNGFFINDTTTIDIIGFTEREKNQIRLFSVPEMKMLDSGGLKVFEDESNVSYRRPMGIAFYKEQRTKKTYLIVSRKEGPIKNYLYQYEVIVDTQGLKLQFARKFGNFSGNKEIEAIAVDEELGYIYYSDEDHCIRKYYASPDKGDEEISCFGGEYFSRDIEGIAIAKYNGNSGFLIVSNQQENSFNVFDRISNDFVMELDLGTIETDGCDVVTFSLGSKFSRGLFVSMSDSKTFYFHDLGSLNLNKD
ncbi:phytase [Winogradskyella poriferorum]|uniref:phytase n=1 Tax=Winogradskyella poriferorum TaxID=307627 RepID=UPI003D66297D